MLCANVGIKFEGNLKFGKNILLLGVISQPMSSDVSAE